jgi:tetratricopeptide (TPR) repeat protein
VPFQPGRIVPARLRDVLLDSSLTDPPDVPARPLDVVAAEWAGPVLAARQRSDQAALARLLPGTIAELHVHAATATGADHETALRLLVDVCTAATFFLRHSGYTDLAWIAADRADRAARLLDEDIWIGAASFALAHCRTSADQSRALRTAAQMADKVEPHIGNDRTAQEVYGMLRLTAALACLIKRDHAAADDNAAEAQRIADRTGDHPNAWQWFGRSNVGSWRTLLAVEAGEPSRALDFASQVEPAALPSRGRRASLAIEKGRAHAMLGQTQQAVAELRKAEKLSPARTYNNPLVRDLVADLLQRAQQSAGGRDLRALGWHMNLIH